MNVHSTPGKPAGRSMQFAAESACSTPCGSDEAPASASEADHWVRIAQNQVAAPEGPALHAPLHAFEGALLPVPVHRTCVEDRVWSVAANNTGLLTVGTAGTRGTCPLRLYDLATGGHVLDMGQHLKNGAGMLDLAWMSHSTFLACGYDTCTRLWDTRCGGHVRTWEEPYDESVYCLATDHVNLLVTGTARHGRVRIWDMRSSTSLYARHAAAALAAIHRSTPTEMNAVEQ